MPYFVLLHFVLSNSIVSACKGTKKNTTMQIPFPKNHFILLPPRTNTIPTIDQQQTFPYNSRTIPVLFPYNKADHDQRRSMTYQSTILGNFCCNKTIVSVFVSKNNVENQLLFAQFKEKQYLCPRNRRWGCGWGARRTDT